MYASIIKVYNLVSNYANKQQQGFITPVEFNSYAESAQMELYHDMVRLLMLAKSNEQRFLTYSRGNYGGKENILDDLSTLLVYNAPLSGTQNVFDLPDNYGYKNEFTYKGREIQLLNGVEASLITKSILNPPTVLNPVGILAQRKLTVLPNSATSDVKATYYKIPESVSPAGVPQSQPPFLDFSLIAGVDAPLISGYRDFELPATQEYKLAVKILSKVGLTIREEVLMQWSNNEQVKE